MKTKIFSYLDDKDILYGLLPACPSFATSVIDSVPMLELKKHACTLDGLRAMRLASPGTVQVMNVSRRPTNDVLFHKWLACLGSTTMSSVLVHNVRAIYEVKISDSVKKMFVDACRRDEWDNEDVWGKLDRGFAHPQNLEELTVKLSPTTYPTGDDGEGFFRIFSGVQRLHFTTPPSREFWECSPQSAVSQIRHFTISSSCDVLFSMNISRFSNASFISLQNVFGSFLWVERELPRLEELHLNGMSVSTYDMWENFSTKAPNLKHLELIGDRYEKMHFTDVMQDFFPNLESIVVKGFRVCPSRILKVMNRYTDRGLGKFKRIFVEGFFPLILLGSYLGEHDKQVERLRSDPNLRVHFSWRCHMFTFECVRV
jgi:hypothetical protein